MDERRRVSYAARVRVEADATTVVPSPMGREEATDALSHPAEVATPRTTDVHAEGIVRVKLAPVGHLRAQDAAHED